MQQLVLAALAAATILPASAGIRSGRAEVSWSTASAAYQPGGTVSTAIRLKADPEWHTYWDNPGEGGMPTGIEWKLPAGWTAGEVGKPVPVRFRTGELAGFGYEGEVWFPVEIHAPEGASGDVTLAAEVTWLTCNDDACVPGDATVELRLSAGEPSATADAAGIAAARKLVPVPEPGLSLELTADGADWRLTLRGSRPGLDPAECAVFPLTPEVVDPAAEIRFAKQADGEWTARVARSEYADGKPVPLVLVLAPPGDGRPLSVAAGGE